MVARSLQRSPAIPGEAQTTLEKSGVYARLLNDPLDRSRALGQLWQHASRDRPLDNERTEAGWAALHVNLSVESWIRYGRLQILPAWDDAALRFTATIDFDKGCGLAAGLAVDLLRVLSSNSGLLQCDVCEVLFAHEDRRRPRSDRGIFCSDACREEGRRRTKRKWWREKRTKAGSQPFDTDQEAGDGQTRQR